MPDIIRYEPFFEKFIFSYQGDLYLVDGPIENGKDTLIITQKTAPTNGLSIPTRVQIQTTNRCNLHCCHCYANSGMIQSDELSDNEIRSFLKQCQESGVLQIEWSGGEPFSRKGFVDLLKFANVLGFEQCLLTNGVALGQNPKLALQVWPYLFSIQISMCGFESSFDAWVGRKSWSTALKGIKAAIAEKHESGKVSISTTIDWSNINDLKHIGRLLHDLGADS